MWEVEREWYQAAKDLHFGLKFLSGLLIILFFTACFVRNANAAVVQSTYDGVVWGVGVVEKPDGSSMESYNPVEGCIVNAPNAFSAACFAVGGNPATLTSDQKALLSNASTGGDFYTFSQNFANYGGSFDSPDDWYLPKFYDVWNMFENLYGDDLYAATFSSAQLRGAKADYQLILNNGSIGGGGSGGTDVPTKTMTLQLVTTTLNRYFNVASGAVYMASAPSTTTLTLTDDAYNKVMAKYNAGYDVHVKLTTYETGRNQWCYITFAPHGKLTFEEVAATDGGGNLLYWRNNTGAVVNTYYLNLLLDVPSCTIGNYVYGGSTASGSGTLTASHYNNGSAWSANAQSGTTKNAGCYYVVFYADGTSTNPQEPVTPPTNWPDNPTVVAPEPPELPEPYNPTIDDQPIDPNPPQNPIYPPILSITEETYTADLQGILDAMDAHCQHLRSALHTEMSNLWTALSTKMTNDFSAFRTYMTGQIGWLGDLISDEMEATRDYLQDLFEWLADEFEYSFTGTAYDDNTLISWLRKIYYRLGSGGVNTRPTDPVANPIDAGDWLSQLIANLFSALNALAGGLLTSVGSALELMRTKFPFSLPWDLLAILALFEASPTAPDFDVPIYTLNAAGQLSQVGAWEIDLSDLSPYLEGIRWMQKICFVYFLAVHTKDWMDTLEKVVA